MNEIEELPPKNYKMPLDTRKVTGSPILEFKANVIIDAPLPIESV